MLTRTSTTSHHLTPATRRLALTACPPRIRNRDEDKARYRARKARNQRDHQRRIDHGDAVFKFIVRASWAEAYIRRHGFPIGRDPTIADLAAAFVEMIRREGK